MSDLCQTCGSAPTAYGICACSLYPEVDIMQLDTDGGYYTRHVSRMTTEKLHSKSDIAAQLGARDREIDELRYIDGIAREVMDSQQKAIRSLRAKLFRERAHWLQGLAATVAEYAPASPRHGRFAARARRLRAKAERVERSGI